MDSKRVSEYLGISYNQLSYLLRKWGASQGKARDYTCHDLTRLRLALLLKNDGYSTKAIQKAINELNKNWNGKTPDNAGGLLAVSDSAFNWSSENSMQLSGDGINMPLDLLSSVPKVFYNVKRLANETYTEMS